MEEKLEAVFSVGYGLHKKAIWPIAKSLTERGKPKAPSTIHDHLGPLFNLIDKAKIIADCL
jgi:hypothetical protein